MRAMSRHDQSHAQIDEEDEEVQSDNDSTTVADTSPAAEPIIAAATVDSRDADPATLPLHLCVSDRFTSTAALHSMRQPAAASSSAMESSNATRPRLTLSAFRRPEQAIRLTKSDPSRPLLAEYDLYAPGCRVLGHGAFSTVRLAVRRCDQVKVAVKSIAKHEALRSRRLRVGGRRYLEEWEILRRLQNHPYIISLLDVFETDDEIQLVLEYCQGGELFDAIQRKRNRPANATVVRRGQYSEPHAARITSQILQALVDLHKLGIVHRDVKAENILLTKDDCCDDHTLHVKLCDFGMARPITEDYNNSASNLSDGEDSPVTPPKHRSYSIVRSNYYMAPEVMYGDTYNTAIDVYSLGVTLYILLCGLPPVFSTSSDMEQVLFPVSHWKDISEEAKDLVRAMLDPNPESRITAKEALSHVWIVSQTKIVQNKVKTTMARTYGKRSRSSASSLLDRNLDLVRDQLYQSLPCQKTLKMISVPATTTSAMQLPRTPSRVNTSSIVSVATEAPTSPRSKRPRRASSCLMALADLYRDVATSPSLKIPSTTSLLGPSLGTQLMPVPNMTAPHSVVFDAHDDENSVRLSAAPSLPPPRFICNSLKI